MSISNVFFGARDAIEKYLFGIWTPGNTWYVSSTATAAKDNAAYGGSPRTPFATLKYALSLTKVAAGDTIVLMPNHTEACIAAGTITISKAGVRIIGKGQGRSRPIITYTTAVAASFDVTANNILIDNVVFSGVGVNAITAMINVSGADFTMQNCEVEHANATNQATLGMLTTAAADRLKLLNNQFFGSANTGTAAAIRIVGGNDHVIRGNFINGNYTAGLGGIDNPTTACLRALFADNVIINRTASATAALSAFASTSGAIVNNRFGILSGTAPIAGGAAVDTVGGNYYKAAAGVAAGTLL